MSTNQLPPLPEPFALSVSVHDGDTPAKTYVECLLYQNHPNEKQRLYTADQMHAYALAALAQQGQEPVAVAGASLLRQPVNNISEISKTIPGGCYCPPGICQAPIIMGRQTPCMRRDTTPPAPQPAAPVVGGWSIDDHRDGSVTIETPEGRIISLHRSGGSGMESTAYSLALLALRPAVEPMTERWVVVRETVLDVGRGSDVRTGGRPELGYALILDAATFDNEADAVAAINNTGLPVGWVVMPLSRLLPDTFGITAKAEVTHQPTKEADKP